MMFDRMIELRQQSRLKQGGTAIFRPYNGTKDRVFYIRRLRQNQGRNNNASYSSTARHA